jgi:ribosomal protein L37AE/L43A
MNGFVPQQSACPACGISRTVRVGYSGVSLCMNCHTRWSASATSPRRNDEDGYRFTRAELERLEIYRRAVAAGLYSG